MKDHDQRFKALIREFCSEMLRLFFASWAERLELFLSQCGKTHGIDLGRSGSRQTSVKPDGSLATSYTELWRVPLQSGIYDPGLTSAPHVSFQHMLSINTIEWLDKEMLPNPPDGSRHLLDMVARIQTQSQRESISDEQVESTLALIHIEIESPDRTTLLKPRLPSYYVHLRDAYSLPVLPIVLYLKVGLDGIGTDIYTERFWELETLRFSYLYVGLPALNGLEYVKGDNWLGVALAALMQIPPDKVVELGLEALRRLSEAPLTDQQKFLLSDCVEEYLPLTPQQQEEFERLLSDKTLEKVQTMNKTTYEKGFEKGIEKGTQNTLLRLGAKQFGLPSPELESQVREIHDLTRLEELIDRILKAQSWDDLLRY